MTEGRALRITFFFVSVGRSPKGKDDILYCLTVNIDVNEAGWRMCTYVDVLVPLVPRS